jgi:hypothetical protein
MFYGLTEEDFQSLGLAPGVPTEEPEIGPDTAVRVARNHTAVGEVQQVRLAKTVGGNLVWVVSFDTATVPQAPPLGYAGPIRTHADGSPDYGTFRYHVSIIDADTGRLLTTSSRSELPEYMRGVTKGDLDLVGVSTGGLEQRGINLVPVVGNDLALADAEQARQVANDRYGPDAAVRETKLARWGGEDVGSIRKAQLLWVMNVDPKSVSPSQVSGGSFGSVPTNPGGGSDDGEVQYLLIFVDAETGKYLDAVGSVIRTEVR